ncbi:S-layer homology domain-containing protein [Sporomusa sp.]|uniref:S-layer homology domain-containing protein n=1 Tax=Sporomusa sp. TaxID=2078658 RepID=UPI002CB04B84|nr:S-layer homology domain-containing protein [Sporomusa sp.]HWR44314.1 S-layer homology domain-containing protein [Sporomusa sp.]
MNKKLLKVAVTTALTVAFAVPAFANPFSDVPAKHWAYDAVNKLAKAGVVTGYGDGTFKGDKTVSRYEMASMIATAMQKNLNNDQKEIVDQLSKEFATELNSMGVKVEALDKKVDNMVKISGDARVRYAALENNSDDTDFRARVSFDGKINDNMKFNARVTTGDVKYDDAFTTKSSINLDTANVTFNALGLTNTIGRQDIKLGNGSLMDTQMTGLSSNLGGLKVFAGNMKDQNRIYVGEYGLNIAGAKITADYVKNDTTGDDTYGANASFKLTNGVAALGEFYKTDGTAVNANAAAYGLKFNKLGLTALYRDVEAGALPLYSNMRIDLTPVANNNGFKGLEVQYDRALAKNTTLNVKYQDFEDQNGIELGARTAATVNVKF